MPEENSFSSDFQYMYINGEWVKLSPQQQQEALAISSTNTTNTPMQSGMQPLVSPDGKYVYVNGEWYESSKKPVILNHDIARDSSNEINSFEQHSDFESRNSSPESTIAVWVVTIVIFVSMWFIVSVFDDKTHEVQYHVSCTCDSVLITIEGQGGGTQQFSNVPMQKIDGTLLEWTHTFSTDFDGYTFLYVSALNEHSSGDVSVSIYVDGKMIKNSNSYGGFSTAIASDMR